MKAVITYSFALIVLFISTGSKCSSPDFQDYTKKLYVEIEHPEMNYDAFHKAVSGYYYLLKKGTLQNTRYLSIVDMSKSANVERFFLIDMVENTLVFKSLIAHGKNTGEEYAKYFSNIENSYQTSIGFYKIAETYQGNNGLSLRMDGLEFTNNNARDRAIVIHKAEYVSHEFISENGRLGRSLGCPVLPENGYEIVVEKIKNGSCFFIYYPDKYYFKKSQILKKGADIQITEKGTVLF